MNSIVARTGVVVVGLVFLVVLLYMSDGLNVGDLLFAGVAFVFYTFGSILFVVGYKVRE